MFFEFNNSLPCPDLAMIDVSLTHAGPRMLAVIPSSLWLAAPLYEPPF